MDKGAMPEPEPEKQGAANAEAPPNEDQNVHGPALSEEPVLPPHVPLYTPTDTSYMTNEPYFPYPMGQGTRTGRRRGRSSHSSNSDGSTRPARLKRENATLGQYKQALSLIPPKVQEIRALLAMLALDIKTLQFIHTNEDDITFKLLGRLMQNKELADTALDGLLAGVTDYQVSMAAAQLAQSDQEDISRDQ